MSTLPEDIDWEDVYDKTTLHLAAEVNDEQKIIKLLSVGANVNARDIFNRTPLLVTVVCNQGNSHFSTIELLLKKGAWVNAQDNNENTPLHYLAGRASVKVIKLLLDFEACVNLENNEGNTPLLDAIRHGMIETVELLLEYGADANWVNSKDGSTPLHYACRYHRDSKITKLLLRSGADTGANNFQGVTPTELLHKFPAERKDILRVVLKYNRVDKVYNKVSIALGSYKKDGSGDWKIVLEHFARIQVLELPLDFIITRMISSVDVLQNYFERCTAELSKAKSCKVPDSWVTYFNLLEAGSRKLKNYAGNQDLIQYFQKRDFFGDFPIYGAQMQMKVKKGIEKRELFDRSSILLSNCVPIFNPNHLVIRDILDCLINTRNLIKICE